MTDVQQRAFTYAERIGRVREAAEAAWEESQVEWRRYQRDRERFGVGSVEADIAFDEYTAASSKWMGLAKAVGILRGDDEKAADY